MQRFSGLSLLRRGLAGQRGWQPQWRHAQPKPAYDALIVGGGGHGLGTAYYLAREHGLTHIAVLEKGWIGSGNTGRNTTIIRSNYLFPESAALYDHAVKLWESLSQSLNYNVMFSPRGVLMLAHTLHDSQVAKRHVHANRAAGVDNEWLTPQQAQAFCPLLNIGDIRYPVLGAALQRRGGTARHDAVAWGYARAADALGVDIIENCEVTGFVTEDGRVGGVETTRGRILAGRTGIAVAGHSSHVAAMAGLRLPVESHILQAFVSEPIKPLVDHVVAYGAELFYISQSDKGGLVFGGHIDGFNTYTQRGQFPKVQSVAECAVAVMPCISRLRLVRHWGGIMDMTPDGSPFIGRTPIPNLYLNGGWCYQGFKATPASGWSFAHTIAHDDEHDLNRCFSLERFERGGELDEHGVGNWTYKQ